MITGPNFTPMPPDGPRGNRQDVGERKPSVAVPLRLDDAAPDLEFSPDRVSVNGSQEENPR